MGLVEDLSKGLTPKQRRHLKALAHPLKPIVLVGQKGVSPNLIDNLDAALLAHELVKVKVHDADSLVEVATELAEACGAQLVQSIGKTLAFYRAHPDEPVIALPRNEG